MTTLPDRPNTALLVIDVQVGVVERAVRRDAVVGAIRRLVRAARDAGAPVIWVQHHDDGPLQRGATAWRIVPELAPAASEPVVEKAYGDAFEGTGLEALLADRRVGRLVVSGAQSDACIRATIHGAFTRGYDVDLVADAHTTEDLSEWGAPPPEQVIAHTNLYWRHQAAPGREARVVDSDAAGFSAPPR